MTACLIAAFGLSAGATETIIGGLVVAFGWWLLRQVLDGSENRRRITNLEKEMTDRKRKDEELWGNWGKLLERVDERTQEMKREQQAMAHDLKSLRDEVNKEIREIKCDVSVLKSKVVEED